MKTKELISKYWDTLALISEANKEKDWQPDMGVALDMLKHECYARNGLFGRTSQYKGVPADFDWAEFEKDIDIQGSKEYVAEKAEKEKKAGITKTKILVNNKIIEVKRVMVNDENYIRLRDFDDVLHICRVDYDKEKNLPIIRQ